MAQAQHTPTLASLHSRECCHACRHPYLALGWNRRPIRWQRSQPRRLTPGPPFSPVSLQPYLLPKHNVVSRRTNACSELYDVSAHGVVFDRDILGVWPTRTSRVGDTDPDLISISAEGVHSHPAASASLTRATMKEPTPRSTPSRSAVGTSSTSPTILRTTTIPTTLPTASG
jgi:hypothetical protein